MLIEPLPGRFERGVVGCEVPVNKEVESAVTSMA